MSFLSFLKLNNFWKNLSRSPINLVDYLSIALANILLRLLKYFWVTVSFSLHSVKQLFKI